jgi:Common central domain of tyrosinase/Polyphenol oxidase middle domain
LYIHKYKTTCMKNYSFSIILILCFSFLGISTLKNIKSNKAKENFLLKKATAIECNTYFDYDPAVKAFVALPTAPMIIRKNVNNITVSEWKNISNAYGKMKNAPVTDFTAWYYQDKIHGGNNTINSMFGTCQHGSCFFLSLHRMYLYFFERIMRCKISGSLSSKPGLPYWNSDKADDPNNDIIPYRFRFKKINYFTKNHLYESNRGNLMVGTVSRSVNSVIHLDPSGATKNNYAFAMGSNNFYQFQNRLEAAHNDLHATVSGFMQDPKTAALDPLFFSHHANIDRLWEKWLRSSPALVAGTYNQRCNPTNASDAFWFNQTFKFYDELGQVVSMTGSQILDVAAQLGYQYDDQVGVTQIYNTTNCDDKYKKCSDFPYAAEASKIIYSYSNKSVNNNENFIELNNSEAKNNYVATGNNVLVLEYEGLNFTNVPSGLIEIYVNPENINNLTPNDKSFAGTINRFSSISENHMMHDKKSFLLLDHLLQNGYLNEKSFLAEPIKLYFGLRTGENLTLFNQNDMQQNIKNVAIVLAKLD